ncbi:MAG: hypothetical protein HRT45_15645 [Bdellovibrionales bacterium]|nr:hypothetical protein [Bdellovibrionales bacterium]
MFSGDQLYAYDGDLWRFRPSDESVFLIPRQIQGYIDRQLSDRSSISTAVRNSWLEKNFFPQFPAYEGLKNALNHDYSSWSVSHEGAPQVHIQFRVPNFKRDGEGFDTSQTSEDYHFAYLHIEFREDLTLIYLRPRPESGGYTSNYFTARYRHTVDQFAYFARNHSDGAMRALFEAHASNSVYRVEAGTTTVGFLQDVMESVYLQRIDQ